jgi:DNA processing protein
VNGVGRVLRSQELSYAGPTLAVMDDIRTAALSMAALELLPAEPADLAAVLGDPRLRAAFVAGDDAGRPDGLVAYLRDELDRGRVEMWEKRLDRLAVDDGVLPVLAGDAAYPPLLAGCWDRPPVLFVRGTFPPGQSVAVVGSRRTDSSTLGATERIARAAADAGRTVVSGLASGVDTAAHTATVDAGGLTVAVIGTGIRRVFPAENASLAKRIAGAGALVSQFAPDAPRTSTTFLRRNCVIAGIAGTSVVMDGEERSGSRHQAEQAVRYGRQVVLWAPALDRQAWAQDMAAGGDAAFAGSVDEAVALIQGGTG